MPIMMRVFGPLCFICLLASAAAPGGCNPTPRSSLAPAGGI